MRQEGDKTSVDISTLHLPPATRWFSADIAFVREAKGQYELLFFQEMPFTGKVTKLLRILQAPNAFDGLISRTTQDFYEGLSAFLKDHTLPSQNLEQYLESHPVDEAQSATERSNLERMAYISGDAEIEFFQISANRFNEMQKGVDPEQLIRPVLGVSLQTTSLLAFLEQVVTLAQRRQEQDA